VETRLRLKNGTLTGPFSSVCFGIYNQRSYAPDSILLKDTESIIYLTGVNKATFKSLGFSKLIKSHALFSNLEIIENKKTGLIEVGSPTHLPADQTILPLFAVRNTTQCSSSVIRTVALLEEFELSDSEFVFYRELLYKGLFFEFYNRGDSSPNFLPVLSVKRFNQLIEGDLSEIVWKQAPFTVNGYSSKPLGAFTNRVICTTRMNTVFYDTNTSSTTPDFLNERKTSADSIKKFIKLIRKNRKEDEHKSLLTLLSEVA